MGAGRTTTGRTGVRAIRLESLAWLRFQHGSLCHRRVATVAESQEDSMMRTKKRLEERKRILRGRPLPGSLMKVVAERWNDELSAEVFRDERD